MPTPFTHPGLTVTIHDDIVFLSADAAALADWATRPGHVWPCSQLSSLLALDAGFDTTGLYELSYASDPGGPDELDVRETNAFTSDALSAVLPTNHPCHYRACTR